MPISQEVMARAEASTRHRRLNRITVTGEQRIRVLTVERQPIVLVTTIAAEFVDNIVRYLYGYQDHAKTRHVWEIVAAPPEAAEVITDLAPPVREGTNVLVGLLCEQRPAEAGG